MKTKFIAVLALLAGSSLFAGPRVAIGFGVNVGPGYGYYAPAPPSVPVYYAPRVVVPQYYARPVFRGSFRVGPRYYGHRYYPGYWRR